VIWTAVVEEARSLHRRHCENVDVVVVVVEGAHDGVGCDAVVDDACEEACEGVAPRAAWSSVPATLWRMRED